MIKPELHGRFEILSEEHQFLNKSIQILIFKDPTKLDI